MLLFGRQFFSRTTRTAPRLFFSSSSLLGAASIYLASAISISSGNSSCPSFIVDAWTTTKASTFASSSSALCFSSFSSDMTASSTTPSSSNSNSNTLIVAQVPCLSDNYGYLVHCPKTGQTAAIDTPEAGPYRAELQRRGWHLTHIFNTHHHFDHTGANLELKEQQQRSGSSNNDADGAAVQIYGPATERIPGIDVKVQGGDEVEFGSTKAKIIDVGGHTKGHIAYYFEDDAKVFVGDSLFALGCGKMFEGTPSQFWSSLKRLRELPDETEVYCAHEYTASNAKFAASVEPGNAALMTRVAEIQEKRSRGEPTVPSLLGVEKQTNPFLRCDFSEELRRNVGVTDGDDDAAAFGKVRRAKDQF